MVFVDGVNKQYADCRLMLFYEGNEVSSNLIRKDILQKSFLKSLKHWDASLLELH